MLAEIDEEGFAFAVNPEDRPVFNKREKSRPRPMHKLEMVLHDGRICVRKRFRGPTRGMTRFGRIRLTLADQAKRHAWAALGIWFYVEAAALLRIAPLPFVPKLRGLDIGATRSSWTTCPATACGSSRPRRVSRSMTSTWGPTGPHGLHAGELTAREVRLVDGAGLGTTARRSGE